jgi:hypothetical protein
MTCCDKNGDCQAGPLCRSERLRQSVKYSGSVEGPSADLENHWRGWPAYRFLADAALFGLGVILFGFFAGLLAGVLGL